MHYFVGLLALLLTVVAAVHAVKTGRNFYWLWVILLLAPIGGLVYFLVEILPNMGQSPRVRRIGSELVTIVDLGRNLRKLEEELEIADTVKNRQMLARGYLRAGRYEEAIELYRQCLRGVFKDDTGLILELAYALFLNGSFSEAKTQLDAMGDTDLGIRERERNLLYARTLEQLGDVDGALRQYQTVVKQASGEEARCRYGMLLEQSGQLEAAREVFQEIVARARRSPGYYRRQEKQWIDIARQNLGSGAKTTSALPSPPRGRGQGEA
jgi:hypothetical protein